MGYQRFCKDTESGYPGTLIKALFTKNWLISAYFRHFMTQSFYYLKALDVNCMTLHIGL